MPVQQVLTILPREFVESEEHIINHENRKQPKVNHAKKATESIKKIVRLFRKYIKDSNVYHSRSIEEYFTCTRFNFSEKDFKSELGIFQELTCCAKSDRAGCTNPQDLDLLYLVFNKSPSKGNLYRFFSIPII